jgi:transcription elongation factor GreA
MGEILVSRKQYDEMEQKVKKVVKDLEDARRRIGEAASYGDLSENSEYEAAKEDEQLFCAMLGELRSKLSSYRVMEGKVQSQDGEVVIGSVVKIKDMDQKKDLTYTIVGGGEFDFDKGEIPYTSPIGGALMGKKKGAKIEVQLGRKKRSLKIRDVN